MWTREKAETPAGRVHFLKTGTKKSERPRALFESSLNCGEGAQGGEGSHTERPRALSLSSPCGRGGKPGSPDLFETGTGKRASSPAREVAGLTLSDRRRTSKALLREADRTEILQRPR